MAGSFGYKKQYYDLSVNVGNDLMVQIKKNQSHLSRQLLASGTSCREQIKDILNEDALHPIEYLNRITIN
jgi:hypothetical protein